MDEGWMKDGRRIDDGWMKNVQSRMYARRMDEG